MTSQELISLMLWGLFGCLLSVVFQLLKYYNRIQNEGGFRWRYFIRDNWLRILLGFPTTLIAIMLYYFETGAPPEKITAFLFGAFNDRWLDAKTNKKT